ncbi:unnamed protein product [Adineta ricciae]|uniref:G-protein coupled receptors family 1 profile domain-containing protein n=1 Tax=Adineta ricciae TaxID=249248 RepID=A0A814IZF0_ADIRI|nr:unnamed protein product [Adineta ricciae]
MSPTIAESIIFVSQKYTIVVYIIIFLTGIVGNICNIIVFRTLKVFRLNQWAFYLVVAAIVDLFLLLIVLPLRIADYGYGYDAMRYSLAWCKIRQTIVPIFSLLSFSAICLASVDQYLSTHYIPSLRQMSSLRSAHRLVSIAICLWTLHGIPFLIFFEIKQPAGCAVYNRGFLIYYSYVQFCTLSGILPITISAISASLAYLNVRRIVRRQIPIIRRRLDRQLTAMVLTKVMFLVVTTLPFVVNRIVFMNIYIDPNDSLRVAIEQLISTVTSSLFYINSAGTFYVFLFVSKRFRQQFRYVWKKAIGKPMLRMMNCSRLLHTENQVIPEQFGSHIADDELS